MQIEDVIIAICDKLKQNFDVKNTQILSCFERIGILFSSPAVIQDFSLSIKTKLHPHMGLNTYDDVHTLKTNKWTRM